MLYYPAYRISWLAFSRVLLTSWVQPKKVETGVQMRESAPREVTSPRPHLVALDLDE